MFIWIYRLFFLPALLVIAPVLLWKSRRREGQWQGLKQRFGHVPVLPAKKTGKKRVWLQAVSVGEVLAIELVVKGLLTEEGLELVITTTTSTGYRVACEKYAGKVLGIAYFPIDFWWCVARAWRAIKPDLFVLMEGERWPEHLNAAVVRNVPVLTINARISDRSFRRMQMWPWFASGLVKGITRMSVVSDSDARRFAELGISATDIAVAGNLKLDTELVELDGPARSALLQEMGFGETDTIIVGASTWPGEEEALLAACRSYWDGGTDQTGKVRLLLVPRHAERAAEIVQEIEAAGRSYHVRSQGSASEPVDVCLADTTGELSRLVQLAEVVWIGKSLPPHSQGQTPVEAARLGKPVLFGPGMGNFRGIAAHLIAHGAARKIDSKAELEVGLKTLLADASLREGMSWAGRAWNDQNRGAKDRTLETLLGMLDELPQRG